MKTAIQVVRDFIENPRIDENYDLSIDVIVVTRMMEIYADQYKQLQKEELRETFYAGIDYANTQEFDKIIYPDFDEWYSQKYPQP